MTTFLNFVDPLFYGLVILQMIALFFFAIAALLRRLTPEPIERIRITVTAFCAIPLVFVVAVTPFVPRWSIALWHKSPAVSQEPTARQVLVETSPMLFPHDMPQPAMTHGSTEILPPSEMPIPVVETTFSAETSTPNSPTQWFLLARGCVLAGFFAVTLGMIAFHIVARVRLRRIMRTTVAAPEWIECLFRDQTADCRNTVTLRVSPHIDSPLLCGLFRPTILLPMSMTLDTNITLIRCALAHEWTHHRHGDLGLWCLVSMCRWLFWPLPLYWHLAGELRVDQDYLADDAAARIIAHSDTDAEQYASVLLVLAKSRGANATRNRLTGQSPALGFADTKPLLTRRIEMLLKDKTCFRRTSRRLWLLMICGLFFGLAAVLGSVRFTMTAAGTLPTTTKTATMVDVQPESEITVQLRLLVVDEEEKPVPGANVELRYSDWGHPIEQSWKTDTDGMVITQIPQQVINHRGRFQVYCKERGLIGSTDFPTDKPGIVDPMEVTCKLIKARRLTGQVLDQDGKPVEGAIVGGTWSYRIGCVSTDERGHFDIDVIPQQPLLSLWAFKPGVGYDSLYPDLKPIDFFSSDDQEAWRKKDNHDNGPFTLKLTKNEPITVKVVDMEGNPIEGILVYPDGGGFSEDHCFEVNCFESLMGQKTDKDGFVVFDWLPSWQQQCMFYANGSNPRFDKTGNARFYGRTWTHSGERKGNEPLVISLPKRVEIQGSVRNEDGSPVARLQLEIAGKNFATVGEYTDHAGNFSYDVNADDPISVHPVMQSNQPLVAPAIYLESVGDGTNPVPHFEFVLEKGTKLFGHVLLPKTQQPAPNA